MTWLKSISLLLILCAASCTKESIVEAPQEVLDNNGVVVSKAYLWKTDISKEGLVPSFIPPVNFNNEIVAMGASGSSGGGEIVGINVADGEVMWSWNDYLDESDQHLFIFEQRHSVAGSNWLIQDADFFYSLDLQNGSTNWKTARPRDGARSEPTVMDGEYYFFLDYQTEQIPSLFKGAVDNVSFEKVLTPSIDSIHLDVDLQNYGDMDNPLIFERGGDQFALLQYGEWVDRLAGDINYYVGLYNLTSQQFLYRKKFLTNGRMPFQGRPVKYDDLFIVNVNSLLIGIDQLTGDIVWTRTFDPDGDGAFRYGIFEDMLVAVNYQGNDHFALALNPIDGTTIWKTNDVGGGASALSYMNGVLYWTNRTDAKLYALEVATGDLLWKVGIQEFYGFMESGVAVIPGSGEEKGKVIVSSFEHAYCYEAAR